LQQPLLVIENLSVEFATGGDPVQAIQNISLTVNRGEIVAIVGESGSGKSVTALSLLQLHAKKQTRYTSGKILFSTDGTTSMDLLAMEEASMRKIRGAGISMIFQEPMTSLNPVYSCGEQVMEAIRLHKNSTASEARKETIELFRKVQLPDPEGMLKRYPHQLSGGQKQRVMIAMAISCNPSLLIADEPTTALDVTVQKNILRLLANLQEQTKMGMLFITHDLGVVQDIAQRVVVMYRGVIVEENTVSELFGNPRHPYTKALLACRPLLQVKGKRLPVVSDFWKAENGEAEPEITRESIHTEKINPGPNPLLSIEALNVWFPAERNFLGKPTRFTKAVDGISFEVKESETLGIVGESGSGKTTLGRALLRLLKVQSGQIIYKGRDLLKMSNKELHPLRKDIQIVFQDPYASLNPKIPVGQAILEAMEVHKILRTTTERKEKTIELLEKVNLKPDHFKRFPHAFSGGQRQRVGIARALALNPGFIVFDESVSALDVSVQAQVLNLINDLKAEYGFTAVFISHDLGVIKYISDRILVLNKGKIEEVGDANQVFYNPVSAYTKKLLEAIPGHGSL
jgi:peptide/nickel transport system ATP-binding protein